MLPWCLGVFVVNLLTSGSLFADSPRAFAVTDAPLGYRGRLCKRFLEEGAAALTDLERVELLMSYALSRTEARPAARRLIDAFGSPAGVLAASDEALLKIEGMTPAAVGLVRLVSAFVAEDERRRSSRQ